MVKCRKCANLFIQCLNWSLLECEPKFQSANAPIEKKRLIFLIFARSIYLSLYLQIKMTVLFRFDSFTFSTHIIIKSSLNVLFNQTYCLFCTNIRVFLDFFCKCFCSFCFVLVCVVGFFWRCCSFEMCLAMTILFTRFILFHH